MSHKIIGLFAILLLFSLETFATQPKQKSEIDRFRNLELQVHRVQTDFDLYLKKLDRDPALESQSKLQKFRLLSQLRQIEKKVQGNLSIPALKVMKRVHDVREKLRGMDQQIKNKNSRNATISFAKDKSFRKHDHPEAKKAIQGASATFISGTVTDETGSTVIPNVEVDIYDSNGDSITYGYTDSSGAYSLLVEDGTYFARTNSYGDYIDELYSEIECEPKCNVKAGTPIVVVGGANDINFMMDTPGRIAGRITDAATNVPISYVTIDIYDLNGAWRAYADADLNGNYVTWGALTTGSYFAVASDYYQGYMRELYQELPCFGDCDFRKGTPISVTQGQITNGIDFTLAQGGSISGKILSAANSSPIPASVGIYDAAGNFITYASAELSGYYEAKGLPSGNYFAITYNYDNFIDELYDNLVCYSNYCEPQAGTPIAVTVEQTTSGINFWLDRGGVIRGHVKDQTTREPIANTYINIYDSAGNDIAYSHTDENGSYSVKGLIQGTYYAVTSSYDQHIDEAYDNIECPAYFCDPLTGTPIKVKFGDVSQINFNLQTGGTIAGKIVDSSNRKPIEYISVTIYDSNGYERAYGYTDEAGRYETNGMATGQYYAVTHSDQNYMDELYNNQPCPLRDCNVGTGDPISVSAAHTTTRIDFALDVGGSISGMITTSDSNPLSGFYTLAFDSQGSYVRAGFSTGINGQYSVGGLPSANFYVATRNYDRYVDELYNNIPCTEARCNPLIGTPVAVTKGLDTPGIDFVLDLGGSISGKIYDAQTNSPLGEAYVNIYDAAGNTVSYGYADASGYYRADYIGLSTGTYFATSYSYSADYMNELYDNIPCHYSCDHLTGTPIQVTAGTDTGNIDFALDHGGRISGNIIDVDTSNPMTDASVTVYNSSGIFVGSGHTDDFGYYIVQNLEAGSYYLISGNYNHIFELYNNIVCPQAACDPLSGTAVSVSVGTETPGINFDLKTCSNLTLTPLALPPGTLGAPYLQVISVSGGTPPYEFQLQDRYLPTGITLDQTTGILSGTPTTAGFFGFELEAHDANGCSSYWKYSITINSGASQYSDDFEDGVLAADWTYKGQWMESGGSLTTTANGKSMAISGTNFSGCVNCTLSTTLRSNSTQGYVSVLGWYPNHKNYVELIMKAGKDRWILKQRSGGIIVAKQKASFDAQPDVTYQVSITFDGINFVVSVNNQTIITMPAGALPTAGKVGYEVKSTAGFFDYINVM